MRELTQSETEAVNGAGLLQEITDDLIYTLKKLPTIYQTAITSTADMMCIATSKC